MPEKTPQRVYDFKVQSYLKPRQYMLLAAEQKMLLRSESEHVSEIIKEHQSRMSENNQRVLLEYFKEMKEKNGKV